jgi:hypothetical protein
VDTLLVINYQEKLTTIYRKDCSNLDEYLRRKGDIFNKLQDANSPMEEVAKIQQLLRGLDDRYIPFKTSVNDRLAEDSGKDFDVVSTKLRNYERSTLNIDDSDDTTESALYSNVTHNN